MGRTRPTDLLGGTTILEGAIMLGDLVDSHYGPDGQHTLVRTTDEVVVASDLHQLLDALTVGHPGAHLVASSAVTQKETIGDGSLTLALLAKGLAERAEALLEDGFHRATIAEGFDRARHAALDDLSTFAIAVDSLDDPRARATIKGVLSGNVNSITIVDAAAEAAELVTRAKYGRRGLSLDQIEFRQVPATEVTTVSLIQGVFLEREPVTENTPTDLENPRIAVIGGGKKAGSGIEERELKQAGGSKGKGRTEVTLDVTSPDDLRTFQEYERADVREQVDRLTAADVDAVFTTMGISDRAISALDDAGIVAFRNLQPDQARRLARATGASIVMHVDELTAEDTGSAGRLHVERHDERVYVRVDDCEAGTVGTLLVSGTIDAGLVSFQRDVMTAVVTGVSLLEGEPVVPGGGGIFTGLAAVVRNRANQIPGREALVMAAYADVLLDIPRTLARNSGVDPIDVVTTMRARGADAVFNCDTRRVDNLGEAGPFDLSIAVERSIDASTDAIIQLVRIDDVLPARSEDDEITEYDLQPDPERDVP